MVNSSLHAGLCFQEALFVVVAVVVIVVVVFCMAGRQTCHYFI
jgi:hypothetical protein